MKINKVYTRTGDDGTTGLVGGHRVKKINARIEAYGTVDELSAQLGLLASFMRDGDDKDLVIRAQDNLFTVCSNLATDQSKEPVAPSYRLDEWEIRLLEEEIKAINMSLPKPKSFILPGGSHEAAIAHVCRTVCRRAERRTFFLAESSEVDEVILRYLNRLSDYLFVLARKLNFVDGVRETVWEQPVRE